MKVYYTPTLNDNATTTRYIHADHLGGMNVTSDENGLADEVVDFHPYGTERIRLGETQDQRQFAGTERDEESSLDYMNARYYSGGRGQFISQDPAFWRLPAQLILDPQLPNSYGYARSNPIAYKDANGEIPVLVVTAGAGALIGELGGIAAQGIADYATGNQPQFSNYAGAFTGGAVQGALIGSGYGFVASGFGGGLAQGVTREGIDAYSGGEFDYRSVAWDTAANAALGPLGGKIAGKFGTPAIAGVTSGKTVQRLH